MDADTENAPSLDDSVVALEKASAYGATYLGALEARNVAPSKYATENLTAFDTGLPAHSCDAAETLAFLDKFGSPATTATAGGRFFGLVTGGAVPAALGARVLASSWDQPVILQATSPIGVKLESVAARWLLDILRLPENSSVGYVSGASMANFTCLTAARNALLDRLDWNVKEKGLWNAPQLRVVASEQIHVTVLKVLSLLGFGTDCVEFAPCDANGAIRLDMLPALDNKTLVLTQAGNVNSGAFDPIGEIAERAAKAGAWVHVDGAFGLWAAASKATRHLVAGCEAADSWVTDGHKWLNTPYDCGMAICKDPNHMHAAMAIQAPYLKAGDMPAPKDMVPELSRSARAVEIWAALHSLGREGVADLVDRCCAHAKKFVRGLEEIGFEILNDVVLNQVVATIPGSEEKMAGLAEHVQQSGDAWLGPTFWGGRHAIRISVSSWVTTEDDVDTALEAIKSAITDL